MPSEISRTLTGKKTALDHETKVLINMIFARFHHIYTHRFESAYGDETTLNQAKREWAISLAGIPANLIEMGLERCKREHAWPPTIAEFLKLTQPSPESLGLPDISAAYQEACRFSHRPSEHRWSHACVQIAAQKAGYFTLRAEPERVSRPVFQKAYLALIEGLANGEVYSVDQPIALPEPDFKPEEELVAQLKAVGVSDIDAQQIAYYLEKPANTDVRLRYRKHAVQKLESLNIRYQLPD